MSQKWKIFYETRQDQRVFNQGEKDVLNDQGQSEVRPVIVHGIGSLQEDFNGEDRVDTLNDAGVEGVDFPKTVMIDGMLSPLYEDARWVTATFDHQGERRCEPVFLYEEGAAVSGILWQGVSVLMDGHVIDLKGVEWLLPFGIQKQNITTTLVGDTGVYAETGTGTAPIYPWGGVYVPGCALDQMRSMYCRVGHRNDGVSFVSYVEAFCVDRAVVVGQGPVTYPETMLGAIQGGYIRCAVPVVDEGEVMDTAFYQSFHVESYDRLTGRVRIVFRLCHLGA